MDCCSSKINAKMQTILRWVLVGLSVLAWIFCVVTAGSCTFITTNSTFGSSVSFGLFAFKFEDGNCVRYPNVSGAAQAGQAFGTLATLTVSAALVLLLLVVFLLKNNKTQICWLVLRILYGATLFCVFLTFTFLASTGCTESDDCTLGAAGILAVLNIFVLIGAITLSWLCDSPEEPFFNAIGGGPQRYAGRPEVNNELASENLPVTSPPPPSYYPDQDVVDSAAATTHPGAVTTTRTIEETPRGRIVTEEVTHPDGTRTVTVTTERDEEGVYDHDEMAEPEMDLRSRGEEQTPSTSFHYNNDNQSRYSTNNEPSEISNSYDRRSTEEPSLQQPSVQTSSANSRDPSVIQNVSSHSEPNHDEPELNQHRAEPAENDEPERNVHRVERSRGADPPGEAEYAPSMIVE